MKKREKRKVYSQEFKNQAIELAKDIGVAEATRKLGVKNLQTLATWVRHAKKMEEDEDYQDIEALKAEIKKLKRDLSKEKKITAILKDATAFFCQDQLK